MNYEFVSLSLSKNILEKLMPLLQQFSGSDKLNLIFTITNILKGDKANKMYFFEQGGSTYFIHTILESTDLDLIEMCISSIKELTAHK